MDRKLSRIVDRARENKMSGASDITLAAAEGLEDEIGLGRFSEADISEFAIALVRSQPNMGSVWNLGNDILLSSPNKESVLDILKRTVKHHESAPSRVGENAAIALKDSVVVTNSSSRAVSEAIVIAAQKSKVSVLVPESRPMREGLEFAKRLAALDIEVTVFGDASLSRAVARADVAIVGSDAVTNSSIIGKVGLLNLVLSSHEFGIDCYVCADSSKFAPIRLAEDARPADEIVSDLPEDVHVENVYFEDVPLQRFKWIVTESGMTTPSGASDKVSGIKVAEELKAL